MIVLSALFLLGALFHCGPGVEAQSTIELLKEHALILTEPLTCNTWDCNCTFFKQRGCCCAASDMFQLEEDTFMRMGHLWHDITTLKYKVKGLADGTQIAFKATMDPLITSTIPGSIVMCFGPFNTDVPIPYSDVTLNQGYGYNPSLGTFTAPCAGVYVFSYTVYSYVGENMRLYHKVQLKRNGEVIASVWENNREDYEDNANQEVVLELQKGDQVYTELMSGRKLCDNVEHNTFTGYILYPHTYDYYDDYDYDS